jgi:two-component system sensor histidine kinase/response regulator
MTQANILIVDDIEANRDLIKSLVRAVGHTPILAEGGLIALEKLKNQHVDLVLLDIMMPEIDGYEVLSHIKDNATLRHIPVIMITALDDMESAVNCIKMGADDYLTKPFKSVLLRARIEACLDRKFLRDKEEDYRNQIEQANLKLEERVHEKTKALAAANERLQILTKAKGDALKLIYYKFQNSLQGLFKKAVQAPLEEANELLDTVKQSLELTKIDSATVMFVFELKAVHTILKSGIKLASEFAQSRYVQLGTIPTCGGQALNQDALEIVVDSESIDEDFSISHSPLAWQIVRDDAQSAEQKELCANALAELLKTAVKFSSYDSTVNFSCEPLENEVAIGIHATGRTIPEKELQAFFEAPSTSQKLTQGRHPGLGPSTAKHIITLLGGSVTVENRQSAGLSFWVKLRRDKL